MTRLVLLFCCFLLPTESLKFLVYNPLWAQSHSTFVGKLAEVLQEAGHQVTVLAPRTDPNVKQIGADKVEKIITVAQCEYAANFDKYERDGLMTDYWGTTSALDMMNIFTKIAALWPHQCNATIHSPGLLEQLRNEKFDAAVSEPMDMCGFAIFHKIGITKQAAALSLSNSEGTFDYSGLPSFPSYVPGSTTGFGERMTFLERVRNTIDLGFGKIFVPIILNSQHDLFKSAFGDDFPDIVQMARSASLFFINAEPLIEFPRPILHKLIDIGGVSVSTGHQPLNSTWSSLLDQRKYTVFISFGTVAKSHLMPDQYKQSIRETAKNFPEATFIWKYERPEHNISEGIDNLVDATWVPQNDLLYDRRLSLFITHGGQGSTTESTTAGVPLIVIPVMGDQVRNAAVINRVGTGIVLEKTSLSNSEALSDAIRIILSDEKYKTKARFLGEMIRNRPFSAKETFVRNMEFLAKYGPLRQFDHYGLQLNFIQYYLIDVFAFLTAIAILSIFITLKTVKFVISRIFYIVKVKKD